MEKINPKIKTIAKEIDKKDKIGHIIFLNILILLTIGI